MKYINKLFVLLLVGVLVTFSACESYMEGLNVDKKALTTEDLQRDAKDVGAFIAPMMRNIRIISPEWQYQLQQNLNADIYSGYMMSASPFANANNPQYQMNDGWNGFIYSVTANNVMSVYLDLTKKGAAEKYPDLYAIVTILKVIAMHRLVDTFGPMPYTEYGQANAKFDSEEQAYNQFFIDLKEAVDVLTEYENDDANFDARFAPFDASTFNGDYEKWIQLANSLRLRLAMRISNVNATKAKTEAEAAINQEYGVLESGDFSITHTFNNPLGVISGGWNDILMGAPMESILGGYDDPRLSKFFLPATGSGVEGQFKGIRNGVEVGTDKTKYIGYSLLNVKNSDAVLLMPAAETHFLRAEAALKGWNAGGTAQSFYESGIAASFDQHGVNLGNYLSRTNKPMEYIDTKDDGNSVKTGNSLLSTASIAWSDASTNAERFEKIYTQKWIALFPEGLEAWSEFRRTGYPKLFSVVINRSGGDVPNGEFISRIPYPTAITSSNPTASQTAIDSYLGGKNSAGTKLWWDVNEQTK